MILQRDKWKEALIAYRKLKSNATSYVNDIAYDDKNKKDSSIPELSLLSFISIWTKEYILDTDLADRRLIKQCAGSQLRTIYQIYAKSHNIDDYNSSLKFQSFRKALKKCGIL